MYNLALVTGVKETYPVMRALLGELDLPTFKLLLEKHGAEVAMVNDLKMNWICAGKSHGGRYACPWCPWRATDGLGVEPSLRTIAEDVADYEHFQDHTKYMTEKKALTCAKLFNNCVRPTLLHGLCQEENPTIDFLRPGPLHLQLRNGNKLVNDLRTVAPSVHRQWLASAGVVEEQYHGELEGRPLLRLLSRVDSLRAIIIQDTDESTRSSDAANSAQQHPARHFPDALSALYVLLRSVSHKEYHSDLDDAASKY